MIYLYSVYNDLCHRITQKLLKQGFDLTITDLWGKQNFLDNTLLQPCLCLSLLENNPEHLRTQEESAHNWALLCKSDTEDLLQKLLGHKTSKEIIQSIFIFRLHEKDINYNDLLVESRKEKGEIHFIQTHLQSLTEAKNLSEQLSQFCPMSDQVQLGLSEILINAIEHGNLEISYDKKTELKNKDCWQEFIEEHLQKSPYKERYVQVTFQRLKGRIDICVKDCGQGFDWRGYNRQDDTKQFDYHGRGLLLAQSLCFNSMTFNEKGNEVTCSISLNCQ